MLAHGANPPVPDLDVEIDESARNARPETGFGQRLPDMPRRPAQMTANLDAGGRLARRCIRRRAAPVGVVEMNRQAERLPQWALNSESC